MNYIISKVLFVFGAVKLYEQREFTNELAIILALVAMFDATATLRLMIHRNRKKDDNKA